jgi:PAS domain S-box-containing protein
MSLRSPKIKLYNTARARLFLLVLLVVIPALGVQVFGAWSDLQQTLNERKLESVRFTDHAQSDFDHLLIETRTVFTDLVRLNDIRSSNNCTQVFTALRFAYERLAPDAVNLALADAHGNIYCAINSVQGDRNIASQTDFQSALQTLDLSAGEYRLNPSTGQPFVNVSYPALSLDGKVQTVIVATFETNWLENWQSEISLPDGASVTLLAPDGAALWQTVGMEKVSVNGLTAPESDWFRSLQEGENAVEGADFDGVVRLHTIVPLGNSAILHLGYPVNELYTQAYANLRWKLALLGLVVVFAFGIAWWVSETMFLHPLNNLLGVVKRVQDGDLSARVSSLRGLGELTTLAHSFDQMTDALQQREAERQQMEQRFRAAFESSAIGMAVMSLDGKILAVNAAVCAMSGYSEDELKQRSDSDNVYPPDAKVGREMYVEMLEGKRPHYSVERRYLRKKGEIFWIRLTLSLVRDAEGQPAYLVGQIEDIDEQKSKSAALAESEARFRTMFETSAIGIGIMGLDGKVTNVNPALCSIFGYKCDELVGQTNMLVLHPDDQSKAAQSMQDLLEGKFNQFSEERRYIRKNGEVIWARITMSMVRNAQGAPLHIVGMLADINEERLTLAKLRESEARFRAMFENAAIGMGLGEINGNMLAANAALCKMSGYTEEELKQRSDSQNCYPEDAQVGMDLFMEMLAGKRDFYSVEKRYVRKNGEVFWTRLTLSLVRDSEGKPSYLVNMVEDIDDKKRKSEALQESEARFRAMFDNAAVGISIISPKGKTLAVNPTLVKLSGRTEAELIELGGRGVTYPEDQNVGMAEFHEILEGKRENYQVEKRYVHEDGRVHWMRQSVSAVRDETRNVRYMIVIAEDIDQSKRASEELRESEARFRAMFDNAAIGIALIGLDRRPIAVNEALIQMTGYSHEEGRALSGADLTYPPDAELGSEERQAMLENKLDVFQVEKRYVHKDGHIFWVRITSSLVRDVDGKPKYVVAMTENIDEKKRKTEELRESEARFRTMFDNAAVGVAVMTLDRHITQINQKASRMTGYTQEEISQIDPSMLAVEEDRSVDRHLFVELVEGKRDQYTVEKRYIRKDGSTFWGRVNFSSVRGVDGKPLYTIGMIEDITEEKRSADRLAAQEAEHRRQLEQRIAERTEELNLANERLREKAAQDAVAAERTRLARDLHDAVTQTLFSTTLIADVLPDIWEMNPDEGKRRLEELRLLTRGALAEMRTLLVELRPNALVEVPLPTLLRQLTEALSGRARINIQLSAEGERKLPADVQISLYRIAQEALNNVFKHSKASEAIVTLRMGETVRLTVADNGAGFDPSTVTADHLGVKIMRERSDAIGAKLSIYSEPGEGTQISVVWS